MVAAVIDAQRDYHLWIGGRSVRGSGGSYRAAWVGTADPMVSTPTRSCKALSGLPETAQNPLRAGARPVARKL
jgi:hypothetical protein